MYTLCIEVCDTFGDTQSIAETDCGYEALVWPGLCSCRNERRNG